jgi:hypothetical protein
MNQSARRGKFKSVAADSPLHRKSNKNVRPSSFDLLPKPFLLCLNLIKETEIFTLCDFAQDAGGKLTIVGTFDQIGSQTFPSFIRPASCWLAACVFRKKKGIHDFKLRLWMQKAKRSFLDRV